MEEFLVPDGCINKDIRSRLQIFSAWLEMTGRSWHAPDLPGYREHLLEIYKPSSAAAHLGTIRRRYRDLLKEDATRERLYDQAGATLRDLGQEDDPASQALLAQELYAELYRAVDPSLSSVTFKHDPEYGVRLTKEQGSALIASPGLSSLMALRDTALLALMLCTGIREQEACNLDVTDLRATVNGELALYIRCGKGGGDWYAVYGDAIWCLAVVDKWLEAAGITEGVVFRSFYRGGRRFRTGRMTTRAVQLIVGSYPIMVGGKLTHIKPHDLRRTYARRCYDEGMSITAIQSNLGHLSSNSTVPYIGLIDANLNPPQLYDTPTEGR